MNKSSLSSSGKGRSPAAPSSPLAECLADAGRLYEEYGHNSFSPQEAASALGVTASAGPFRSRLASWKMYGLIIKQSGQRCEVSKTFKVLWSATKETSEFTQAALQAIRSAQVFREVLDAFPASLPNSAALARHLEIERRFHASKARQAASVLHQCLAWAGLIDSKGNLLLPAEGQEFAVVSTDPLPHVPPTHNRTFTAEIPVSHNQKVIITYPRELTAHDAVKVGRVLEVIVA